MEKEENLPISLSLLVIVLACLLIGGGGAATGTDSLAKLHPKGQWS
jgi:hypothetical protein